MWLLYSSEDYNFSAEQITYLRNTFWTVTASFRSATF
jgi:hypothetical protein